MIEQGGAEEWSDEVISGHMRLRRQGSVVWSESLGPLTIANVDAQVRYERKVLSEYGTLSRLLVMHPHRVIRTPRAVWDHAEHAIVSYEHALRCVALTVPGRSLAEACLRVLWSRALPLMRLGARQRVFDDTAFALKWISTFPAQGTVPLAA